VALKLPRDPDGDQDRFLDEALHVARLKHPGIVTLFDADRSDGTPFLASELVAGPTLRERLRDGGLTFRQAAELIAALAEAWRVSKTRATLQGSHFFARTSKSDEVSVFWPKEP
jgi:serine/threonine protein kinase